MIVKKTMESILTSYPGMMAMSSALGGVNSITQPISHAEVTHPPIIQTTGSTEPNIVSAKEEQAQKNEPPSMADMKLESLSIAPKVEEKTQNQAQAFSSEEIEDLNKALEALSKSPLATEASQNTNNAVAN